VSELPVPIAAAQIEAQGRKDIAVEALRALLDHPALKHDTGLTVLGRMAVDPNVPARERRRCGEVLATLKLKAVELYGALTGSKEQHLHALGISQAPQEVHVEQHNTKIEIVREGARDWRTVEGG